VGPFEEHAMGMARPRRAVAPSRLTPLLGWQQSLPSFDERKDVVGRIDCSVTIHRPIEEVFAVLTDPTRSPEWSKHSIRGELLTEGPPRVGSRRRTVVKGLAGIGTMESVFEVTEIDPLRAVALRQVSASWGGSGATRYTFTSVDGGTRVDWTWELNPGGLMKLLFGGPVMAMTGRLFQADLENLKALMEAGQITAAKSGEDVSNLSQADTRQPQGRPAGRRPGS
jgi:uncharacterized protein YndB with AHSA1/START domain